LFFSGYSELAKALGETDQRKDSQVTSLSSYGGNKFHAPEAGISIFDTNTDFTRIPEKTHGEKHAEEVKAENEARLKDPYIKDGKVLSSSDVVNRLFDSLMQGK